MNFRRLWKEFTLTDRIFAGSAIIVIILLICGCSQTRDQKTETVTKEEVYEEYRIPPLEAKTFAGTITTEPATLVKVTKKISNQNATLNEQRESAPSQQVTKVIEAGLNSVWPGLGTVGAMGFAAWKMFQNRQVNRQLTETIDGVEEAKEGMGESQWQHLTSKLAKKQSADTQEAVRKRTERV